jgi:hypothetical protein
LVGANGEVLTPSTGEIDTDQSGEDSE